MRRNLNRPAKIFFIFLLFAAFQLLGSLAISLVTIFFPSNSPNFYAFIFIFAQIFLLFPALLVMRCVLKRPFSSFWMTSSGWALPFSSGLLAGFGLTTGLVLLLVGLGGLTFDGLGDMPVIYVLLFARAFAVQGSTEEIIVRGLIQRLVKDRLGIWMSLYLPSLLFGLLHLANPNFSWIAMANTTVIGLLLALLVYLTGSIWFSCGLHAAWNYFLSVFFGQVLSGLRIEESVLVFRPTSDNPLLIGGAYGPEASLLSFLINSAITAAVLILFYRRRKQEGVTER